MKSFIIDGITYTPKPQEPGGEGKFELGQWVTDNKTGNRAKIVGLFKDSVVIEDKNGFSPHVLFDEITPDPKPSIQPEGGDQWNDWKNYKWEGYIHPGDRFRFRSEDGNISKEFTSIVGTGMSNFTYWVESEERHQYARHMCFKTGWTSSQSKSQPPAQPGSPDWEGAYGIMQDAFIKKSKQYDELKNEKHPQPEPIQTEAQDEYINFIGDEVGRLSSFGFSHPWMAASQETIERGIELRKKIADAKSALSSPEPQPSPQVDESMILDILTRPVGFRFDRPLHDGFILIDINGEPETSPQAITTAGALPSPIYFRWRS